MDEDLSMNQSKIEETVSIRPSFLFIISLFFFLEQRFIGTEKWLG